MHKKGQIHSILQLIKPPDNYFIYLLKRTPAHYRLAKLKLGLHLNRLLTHLMRAL